MPVIEIEQSATKAKVLELQTNKFCKVLIHNIDQTQK